MIGVLNVLKPPGLSSHDVVARLRRMIGERQIGHGGTLDPGAAGVLPVLVGKATKLMPFVARHRKGYRAELTLGVVTDSQDAAGRTLEVNTGFSIPPRTLGDVLATFLGEIEQVPPMASALKRRGRRLYEWARDGVDVEREPRAVTIYGLSVRGVFPRESERLVAGTRVLIDVECSKGTYVRALCHDIGRRLGCGAHMSFLVRLAVGPLKIVESLTLEEIEDLRRAGRLADALLLPPGAILGEVPAITVDSRQAERLRHGQALHVRADLVSRVPEEAGTVQVTDSDGALVCIARVESEWVQPVRVF